MVPDIIAEGAFDEVLQSNKDIDSFIHTACPVDFQVNDIRAGLLQPALEGTRNALSAIEKYGNVKTVVATSSTAAVRDSDAS